MTKATTTIIDLPNTLRIVYSLPGVCQFPETARQLDRFPSRFLRRVWRKRALGARQGRAQPFNGGSVHDRDRAFFFSRRPAPLRTRATPYTAPATRPTKATPRLPIVAANQDHVWTSSASPG